MNGCCEFAFGLVHANAATGTECSRSRVFFRWNGSDEGDAISGYLSAGLQDDGTIEIELSFDAGDEAILKARRE
jgi:hypothetical protein